MKIYPTELVVGQEFYLPVTAQLIEEEKGVHLDISFGKRPIRYQDWTPINVETRQYWMYVAKGINGILINHPEIENCATILVTPRGGLDTKNDADYAKIPLKFEEGYMVSPNPKIVFELKKTKSSIQPEDISIELAMYNGAARAGTYHLKGSPEKQAD